MTTFAPVTKRRVKIYELCKGPGGRFSNNSQDYALHGRYLAHVAARSLREAFYHAYKGHWRAVDETVGIVEEFDGECWRLEDGSHSTHANYRHGGSAKRVSRETTVDVR